MDLMQPANQKTGAGGKGKGRLTAHGP
jgi:hypothetical protein